VNPILQLAADLLDRASDPRLGVAANEMAALQLDDALQDEAVRARLSTGLVDGDDDLDAMPFAAWLWLLGWEQREGLPLDERVLAGLTRRAASVDRRLRLRALVGRDPQLNAEAGPIDEYRVERRHLPSAWLTDQVKSAAGGSVDPFELIRHLLQIGTDVSLATLVTLLDSEGPYRDAVRDETRRYLGSLGLDPDQYERWISRLGLDRDR
jgi:hypothetical protein